MHARRIARPHGLASHRALDLHPFKSACVGAIVTTGGSKAWPRRLQRINPCAPLSGLASSWSIMRAHGGQFSYVATPDGALFGLWLPG